jgi:hypothetical protein
MNVSRRGRAEIKRVLLVATKSVAGKAAEALLESLSEAMAVELINVVDSATSTKKVRDKIRVMLETRLTSRAKEIFPDHLRTVASKVLLKPSEFDSGERQRLAQLLGALKRPLKPSSMKVRLWAREKHGSYRKYRWKRLFRANEDVGGAGYGVDTGSLARMLGSKLYTKVELRKVNLEGWKNDKLHEYIDRSTARKLMAGMRMVNKDFNASVSATKSLLASLMRKESVRLHVSYDWTVKTEPFAPGYYQLFAKQPGLNILENKGVATVALFRALQSEGVVSAKPRT